MGTKAWKKGHVFSRIEPTRNRRLVHGIGRLPHSGRAVEHGAELLLDSNVIVTDGKRLLESGQDLVKADVSVPELRNAVSNGSLGGVPKAADSIATVPGSTNIDLRINIRGELPAGPGRFGDGVIGAATAIDRGATLVTRDKNLMKAVETLGGTVKTSKGDPMISWEILNLGEPAELRFSDGVVSRIEFQRQSVALGPRPRELALLSFADGTQLELDDCVDTSPNAEKPSIIVVRGERADQVLVFGGETLCAVSSGGRIVAKMPTFRKRRNCQFWRSEVVRLDSDAILVIYEVGAFVVESSLRIRWHVEKALIDFFDRREGRDLVFLRDHEIPFCVDVLTGKGVPS